MTKRILIVAGEASADIYGAHLYDEFKRVLSKAWKVLDVRFVGVGGQRMRDAGVDVRMDAREFSVVGISEWIGRARQIYSSFRRLCRWVETESWDAAVLIDLPDVNFRLAKRLKRRGIPVCYYVSPQLWAWRSGRIELVRRYVDRMLVLFPFEEAYYLDKGVQAQFVGHPLVDMIQAIERPVLLHSKIKIAVFPGSRKSEIRMHARLLGRVMKRLRERFPECHFTVPVPGTLDESWVRDQFREVGDLEIFFSGDSHEALRNSDVGIIASGTATLEAALSGLPFSIFYKVRPTSKLLFDAFVRVPFIGMPNLLAGKEIVREYFQSKATVDALVAETIRLVEDSQYRAVQSRNFEECRKALRTLEPNQTVGKTLFDLIQQGSHGVSFHSIQ